MGNKIKIIHIVESLHKGAVENWLVRMFIYGQENGADLDWTFYCTEELEGRLEQKVIEYGGKIIKSPSRWANPKQFIKDLRLHLRSQNYDVMHCHHDFVSALYLIAARGQKLKKIVQIHNMDEHIPVSSKLKKGIIRYIFRRICWFRADLIVGISKHTLDRFTLGKKKLKKKSSILYYGIAHERFLNADLNKSLLMSKYEIPEGKKVILFCARIDPAKNPIRALEVFHNLINQNQSYFLLIVGSGGLESEVKAYIKQKDLKQHVNFIGWSDDIPFILKNSDLLLYPHQTYPMEGLGIVLVETQLSGTPILGSFGIGEDASFYPGLVKRIPLKEDNSKWSEEIINLVSVDKPTTQSIEKYFKLSSFYMPTAMANLMALHQE